MKPNKILAILVGMLFSMFAIAGEIKIDWERSESLPVTKTVCYELDKMMGEILVSYNEGYSDGDVEVLATHSLLMSAGNDVYYTAAALGLNQTKYMNQTRSSPQVRMLKQIYPRKSEDRVIREWVSYLCEGKIGQNVDVPLRIKGKQI